MSQSSKNDNSLLEKRAELTLQFHLFPDLLITLSDAAVIQVVNKAFEEVTMYTASEVEGKSFEAIVSPDRSFDPVQFVNGLRYNGPARNVDSRLKKKDGSSCYINWSAYWCEQRQIVIASGRDVTDVIDTQKKQNARENLFEALIENSFDLLGLTDVEGRYLYLSDTFKEIFGYEREDMMGKVCFSYMHPDDLPRIMNDNRVLHSQSKKIYVAPYRFRHASGHWLWVESVVTNQLNHPDIRGVVISARDVTNQFNTEAKLKEMQLLEALQEGEEKERSRIARDLHDEISGMIAAAKMQFSSLSKQAPDITSYNGYQQGMHLLENAALQVRRTSHNLMPEILLENGLAEALQRYCSNFNSGQLKIEFFSLGENLRHSPAFELALYRIAQELLGNVLKHSGATEALVQLSQHADILSLTIEDNGKGFCTDAHRNGTGLHSIRKRVEAMSGTMDIQSEQGQGTHIYLEFKS